MLTESPCISAAHRKDKLVMERNRLVTGQEAGFAQERAAPLPHTGLAAPTSQPSFATK
jgi:hypothetical protein